MGNSSRLSPKVKLKTEMVKSPSNVKNKSKNST